MSWHVVISLKNRSGIYFILLTCHNTCMRNTIVQYCKPIYKVQIPIKQITSNVFLTFILPVFNEQFEFWTSLHVLAWTILIVFLSADWCYHELVYTCALTSVSVSLKYCWIKSYRKPHNQIYVTKCEKIIYLYLNSCIYNSLVESKHLQFLIFLLPRTVLHTTVIDTNLPEQTGDMKYWS